MKKEETLNHLYLAYRPHGYCHKQFEFETIADMCDRFTHRAYYNQFIDFEELQKAADTDGYIVLAKGTVHQSRVISYEKTVQNKK